MNYEEENYQLVVNKGENEVSTTVFTYSDNINFSGFWFYNDSSSYAVNDKGEIINDKLKNFNLESGTFVRRIGLNDGEIGETQNVKNEERIVYIGGKAMVDGISLLYNKNTLEIIKCGNTNWVGKYYVEFNKPKTETETEIIQLIVEIVTNEGISSGIILKQIGSDYNIDNNSIEINDSGVSFNIINNNNKIVYAYISRNIKDEEFRDNDVLLGVHLTPCVKNINKYAFSNCTSLTQVEIPNSVETMKEAAFSGCNNLKEIVIPNSIKIINMYVFYNCFKLEKIKISNNATIIHERAFYKCSLEEIIIPNNVISINNEVFSGCGELKRVVIPNTLNYIGDSVFEGCNKIEVIIVTRCNSNDNVKKNIKTAFGIGNNTHEIKTDKNNNTITYEKI